MKNKKLGMFNLIFTTVLAVLWAGVFVMEIYIGTKTMFLMVIHGVCAVGWVAVAIIGWCRHGKEKKEEEES